MANDINIGNLISGVSPTVKTKGHFGTNTATYGCSKGVAVLSPVAGKIEKINGTEVIIESNAGNKYTINGVTPTLSEGTSVTLGGSIGTTSSTTVILKSKQDLSSLKTTSGQKELDNNNKSPNLLNFSDDQAQKYWDASVGQAIAVANAPYNVASKALNSVIQTTQTESIEIKDNVLSEELKRIKSLF